MPRTNIRGSQVLDSTIQRDDLDTATVGQSVVRKIVEGDNMHLSSTGADAGTGDVTVRGKLFIQNAAPLNPPPTYLWIQTGIGLGTDLTFWVEDGL
jgi:hypothetical protein